MAFRELLHTGKQTCEPDAYIFPGRAVGAHLAARTVESIVRRATERAGLLRPISVTTLRHSYLVRRLENGIDLRQLQHELGHASTVLPRSSRLTLGVRHKNRLIEAGMTTVILSHYEDSHIDSGRRIYAS